MGGSLKNVRVLVTFALGGELGPWRRQARFCAESRGGIEAYRKRQGSLDVVAFITGAGMANAGQVAARVLAEERWDLVISSGLAGGLRPEFGPGTVVVARKVVRWEDGCELVPSEKWTELAVAQGAREVTMVSSNRVAQTVREKQLLGETAETVEMESFAVLEAAAARGIPAAAIRAVSDAVEGDLPLDFGRVFDARGRVRGRALAGQLVRKPAAIGGLVRLAGASRRAAKNLGEFLERYVGAAEARFSQ